MEDFRVAFRFHECRSLKGLEDVVSLAQMLPGYGFLPAEPPNDPKPSHDVEALVRRQWKPKPTFRPEKPFDSRPQYEVFFRIIPVRSPEVLSTFSCKFYSLEHSTVELGGFVDIEPQGRSSDLELYAQNLLELAQSLYLQLSPIFGWVDEDEATGRWIREALAVKLKVIGWANFFGPAYVEKFGRKFLMGLPGWKVKELEDGGVFHQLTPSILASDEEDVQQLQDQVIAYCRQAGVRVRCRGRYVLRSIECAQGDAESSEGYGTNEELQEYSQQILSTTLVLKDGTRVKPIYIEWVLLSPEQRQIVLSFIKQAAMSEIRQHRNTRIRFEFNEIPDDLDRMMRRLVGVNNPDFMYVQVDMG
jgi:hypothetical protein